MKNNIYGTTQLSFLLFFCGGSLSPFFFCEFFFSLSLRFLEVVKFADRGGNSIWVCDICRGAFKEMHSARLEREGEYIFWRCSLSKMITLHLVHLLQLEVVSECNNYQINVIHIHLQASKVGILLSIPFPNILAILDEWLPGFLQLSHLADDFPQLVESLR
jgi:hypothetical protein